MLQKTHPEFAENQRSAHQNVEILCVATSVPEHALGQDAISRRAQTVFPQYARLEQLYTNTGIDTRYACMPEEWYLNARGWEETSEVFQRHALDLIEKATLKAIGQAAIDLEEIDILVTNTVTGLSIPSLEAHLMNRLPFRRNVMRVPMFGLGCGAGVAGLARAAHLARSDHNLTVLFLTVDLCTLCLRLADTSIAMFVSTALFGDGAAAVILRSGDASGKRSHAGTGGPPRYVTSGEYLWEDTEHIMGWDIKEDGFGVVLSRDLPSLMRDRLGEALDSFLENKNMSLSDFDGFLFHPGGRKVLETAQLVLGIEESDFAHSWKVLRDYGNMSSPTALFVLNEAIQSGAKGRHLLAAFGPGFSAYFTVIDL